MTEETSIIPVGNSLIRQLIEERQNLSLGELASSDLRTLTALEREYWQRLQNAGIPIQWKTAMRLTFKADLNGCIEFDFSAYHAKLDKTNGLVVKRESEVKYDDREAAHEIALPGEWMIEMEAFITEQQKKAKRTAERHEENARIAQIERLKG